ncbi:MAG: sigma-70 family RNA polymerase sigma factor [Planctomycetes bacterium]|nr:sigma-70 family RNA polymerase sigma factor [Planctomycetota bacterium]
MHDDSLLFGDAVAGDERSLDLLLERYLPALHAYVRVRLGRDLQPREASVDVVQSVCRQVLAGRAAFEFRGEERFRAWLFTAALNKIREKHRLHHRGCRDRALEQRPAEDEGLTAAAFLVTPSQAAIGKETAEAIEASLAALSEEHREVVTLARLVRLPHKVIGEMTGRSEEAARKMLARAMLALTDELERRGVDLDRWHRA